MTHIHRGLLPILLVAVPLLTSAADTDDSKTQDQTLPPVATAPRRLETPVEQLAGSITIIGRAEIERKQLRTLADALEEVPGLNTVQLGGPGQQTSVFARGSESNHTLVLIDGIEVSDPSLPGGVFEYAHLLTENIERIEVLRGPQSALYGSDAIGGVVNVITRKGKGRPRLTSWVEGGAFNTVQASAAVHGGGQLANYSVSISDLHTRGFTVKPKRMGAHERDGHDNTSLATRFGLTPASGVELNLFGRLIDTGTKLDDFSGDDRANTSDSRQLFLRAESKLSLLGGNWTQTFGTSYTDHDRKTVDTPDATSTDWSKGTYDGTRLKFDWQNDVHLDRNNVLTVGLETERETVDSASNFGGDFGDYTSDTNDSLRTSAVYVQEQFGIRDRVFGSAAVRLDHHDEFGSHTTYRTGMAYLHPETATKLRGSVAAGFKAPSLFDLFGESSFGGFTTFHGNPDLDPEKSVGWELGVEQELVDGHIKLGTTYFKTKIRDLISTTADWTTLENVDRAKIHGFESFLHTRVAERLWLRLDHTYTSAESDETGEDLLRRPKHKLTGSLEARITPKATATLGAVYIGSRKDSSGVGRVTLGGYTVVNATASYQLLPGWQLFGRINNLFNRDYEDPEGYNTAGFFGFAGIKSEF